MLWLRFHHFIDSWSTKSVWIHASWSSKNVLASCLKSRRWVRRFLHSCHDYTSCVAQSRSQVLSSLLSKLLVGGVLPASIHLPRSPVPCGKGSFPLYHQVVVDSQLYPLAVIDGNRWVPFKRNSSGGDGRVKSATQEEQHGRGAGAPPVHPGEMQGWGLPMKV